MNWNITDHYDNLNTIFKQKIPRTFCFNVDECGNQSWAEKLSEKVIVPASVDENSTKIGVDRASSCATLLGCFNVDGSSLKPFVVITRKTIEVALKAAGHNPAILLLDWCTSHFSDFFLMNVVIMMSFLFLKLLIPQIKFKYLTLVYSEFKKV